MRGSSCPGCTLQGLNGALKSFKTFGEIGQSSLHPGNFCVQLVDLYSDVIDIRCITQSLIWVRLHRIVAQKDVLT